MNHPRMPQHDERSVRLLPRHWQWLEAQPRGINANLRLLVEMASRDADGRFRTERLKETCYLYMRDMAGDRPHFEAAVRALFASDVEVLQRQIASWPPTVQARIGEFVASMQMRHAAEGAA